MTNITETASPKLLKRLYNDTLYRNSFFLVTNRGLVVLTGFVFWMVATRLYPVNDVGLAVAFVSSAQLIMSFSLFGFDTSIIRFFNNYDKSSIFNTSIILVIVSSLALGILYIAGVQYFSPDLAILHEPVYAAIFLLFTVAMSLSIVTSQTFIALRDAKYSFIQNVLLTLRIPLLIPLIFLGSFGILSATFIAYILVYAIVLYFLSKFLTFRPKVDLDFLKLSYKFSFGNYISNLVSAAAFSLIPLIVLNLTSKADVGIYYMGYTVGYFALQIPVALSTSLFVEGVYGESLKKNLKKTGLVAFGILSATVAFFAIFGQYVLALFGSDYVSGIDLLRLIALSSFPYAAYVMFTIILNVKMRVNYIILLNVILFLLVDGLSYLLIPRFGITGIGYAFIIAFVAVDLYILYLVKKWGWI
jgi:O-antigen/teichoic acid export membrane protein